MCANVHAKYNVVQIRRAIIPSERPIDPDRPGFYLSNPNNTYRYLATDAWRQDPRYQALLASGAAGDVTTGPFIYGSYVGPDSSNPPMAVWRQVGALISTIDDCCFAAHVVLIPQTTSVADNKSPKMTPHCAMHHGMPHHDHVCFLHARVEISLQVSAHSLRTQSPHTVFANSLSTQSQHTVLAQFTTCCNMGMGHTVYGQSTGRHVMHTHHCLPLQVYKDHEVLLRTDGINITDMEFKDRTGVVMEYATSSATISQLCLMTCCIACHTHGLAMIIINELHDSRRCSCMCGSSREVLHVYTCSSVQSAQKHNYTYMVCCHVHRSISSLVF